MDKMNIISDCLICGEHSLHILGQGEKHQTEQCINCGYVTSEKFKLNGKKKQQAISKRNKSLQKKLKSEDIVSGRAGVQEERELAREASALKVQYVTMASPIQSKLRSKDKKTRDEIVQNYLYGIFDW